MQTPETPAAAGQPASNTASPRAAASTTHTVPAAFVLNAYRFGRQAGKAWVAYAGHHPYTGSGCESYQPWRAHGGPLISPWTSGFITGLADRTKREHGRREVLRTWGVGIRALQAEQRSHRT